uniref:40S ribosomal protein S11-like n=1 Tax=Geotrypetes seraphini TaxID=260995 RepID=A0A6P8QYQ5_GEOSA|nr:40S ribosomal protein S11-like [Geotrypetes seraphini]
MADIHTEHSDLKQLTTFQNKKHILLSEGRKKLPPYYKNIGLDFKTPYEDIESTYIVIYRDYLHYIRKYNWFEKRYMSVHLPLPRLRDVQIGDIITVGECHPLCKTVCFSVPKVMKVAGTKKQFQEF